jgi:purine-binding chemotaxis protein CheW
MSIGDLRGNDRAAALRQAFDLTFAHAPSAGAAAVEGLLAISVAGDRYLLRLSEVAGLFADKTVVALPSPVAELLGIAGFRSRVLPVYDLAMLLGRARPGASRWLVVAAATSVGFAFEGFDGYLRVRQDAIVPARGFGGDGGHVREILQDEVARPIIHLPSIVETVGTRGGQERPGLTVS